MKLCAFNRVFINKIILTGCKYLTIDILKHLSAVC